VDRVLEGLLALDFKDFMRVGSLRKISKRVIDYAPQADGTPRPPLPNPIIELTF
jgi:hypothetical protein